MDSNLKRSGILACGNFLVDHVKTIDAWPEEESLALILESEKGNGGGPYNLLKDLRNLGASYQLQACGLVGNDAYGEYILKDLEAYDISTNMFSSSYEVATAHTDVMADSQSNRRTFFYHSGANKEFILHRGPLKNSSSKILYYGYIGLLPQMDQLDENGVARFAECLKSGKEEGFITVADAVSIPNPQYPALIRSALSSVDYLFINDHELHLSTGAEVRGENQQLDCVKLLDTAIKLRKSSGNCILIVHFPEGAVAIDKENQPHWQGSLTVEKHHIRGSVGAGDAFCAGFLYGLHEDQRLEDCLELAVCSAAACLLHPTASGGILSESDCLDLACEWPARQLP